MSLEAIIHKASTEPGFRQLLLENPTQAISGYDLTEEEKAALSIIKASLSEGTREGARRETSALSPEWT
ncbi:MAG: hypothetical protein EPO21_20750 [Chloroflexota bacterium]|nr:MAG: hypothetical protein EPO21_20750 [Chloroflexota bacterium]